LTIYDEYWLIFAGQAGLGDRRTREGLLNEAAELLAIFAASQITAKFAASPICNQIGNRRS
jgi:hypothetical protein